jgi:hypothetical protein
MKYVHTHSDRLERWLGADKVAWVTEAMRDFYWPIAVAGVPGTVYAMPGGDFTGKITVGQEMSVDDRAFDIVRCETAKNRALVQKHKRFHKQDEHGIDRKQFNITSLSTMIGSRGKVSNIPFAKLSLAANTAGQSCDWWPRNGSPPTGVVGGAAPSGTVLDYSSTGALPYANPVVSNSNRFMSVSFGALAANTSLLLYDRLFSVSKTMSSSATEAVTGVPTRYQNTSTGNDDYIGGNFCYPLANTTLAAVAHSWTVCQYTNQAGTASQSFPSVTGVSGCVAGAVDMAVPSGWFMPLASGDVGVKAISQMQCSVATVTGTLEFVVGHPIAFFPYPLANIVSNYDALYTSLQMTRIYDNACLSMMEINKITTASANITGNIVLTEE